ncbi:uncharacterized protein LY89DRAFT_266410 [Mollisia scopiformis]|uniref:RING-type domain-containing protein n=1 Tax=Mollisia scopiformis TaxID=149040 RepID=A0A132BC22_MOLSC|nr:uncharacterized protein LY89DRAFT_266410 [Mollisia scopiformis]KUJ09928.1 hypothetical protein LY89DRAFT_266410 [Mollisia scopiformis]
MSNSPGTWNWDSPGRQPADPSTFDSPRNNNNHLPQSPYPGVPWFEDDNDLDWAVNAADFEDFDDGNLTLAPINPENTFGELPPLAPGLLDAPSRSRLSTSSSDPFISETSLDARNLRPPPSNREARARREPPRASSVFEHFLVDDSPDPFGEFSNLTPSPPTPNMAPSNHTRSSSFVDLTASSPPQPRPAPTPSRKRKAETPGEGRPGKSGRTTVATDDVECVDLIDVEGQKAYEELKAREQAEAIKAQYQAEATKPMKLAEFKCIICMDDPTDLTVTHCGHLFCSECLHQALHAGERKCCPVCRTAIVIPRTGQKPSAKGYFPLSMKLTTAKKQGKRPIRA